jgi:hypothetical protein
MQSIDISTPALVFPALSVLMLAYTNRFIAISKRVRALHAEHKKNPTKNLLCQIKTLQKRLTYIRNMQSLAISGFLINMVCIFLILFGSEQIASILFSISLLLIMSSLIICLLEIYMSVKAMSLMLEDDEDDCEELDTI